MMDAAAGKRGRAEGVAGHAALRQALGPSPAVLLTAVLPKPLREKLKAEMNDTIGGGAPTDLPEHERSYAAVLAVEAAGVALGFAGGDRSQVQLAAELRCETPSACADVGKLIERKRAEFSRGFAARLLGLSPLLDSLAVTPSGPALRLTAHAPTAEVSDAIGRLLDLRSPAPPPSAPAPSR
jgi:hypothetical protein